MVHSNRADTNPRAAGDFPRRSLPLALRSRPQGANFECVWRPLRLVATFDSSEAVARTVDVHTLRNSDDQDRGGPRMGIRCPRRYELDLGVERIRAARWAIDDSGTGVVLTRLGSEEARQSAGPSRFSRLRATEPT